MSERPHNNTGPAAHSTSCGFCGKHRDSVILLVMSGVSNATICCECAMGVVTQSMGHMVNTAALVRSAMREHPEIFERAERGQIRVVPANERLKAAIEAEDGNGS